MKITYPIISSVGQTLVSDSIKDNISKDTFDISNIDDISNDYIIVTACAYLCDDENVMTPVAGILKSTQQGVDNTNNLKVEIDYKVNLDDVMTILNDWDRLFIKSLSMRLSKQIVDIPGHFIITSVGVYDIDPKLQTAIMTLTLLSKKPTT